LENKKTTMPIHSLNKMPHQLLSLLLALLIFLPLCVSAQENGNPDSTPLPDKTIDTLSSFNDLKIDLQSDIKALTKELAAAHSEAEKNTLKQQLEKLETDLATTRKNFENIAAGIDITSLREAAEEEFNFQKEIFALLKPALDEMKDMTAHVRQKSDLKEKITYYEARLPVIEKALANIEQLNTEGKNKSLVKSLQDTIEGWKKQQAFMQSELHAAQLELDKLVSSETSIAEASQSYLKSFFQKRGLYLIEALLVVAAVVLLSRLSYAGMSKYLPGFRRRHRSFRVRLIELIHRLLTVLLIVLGPTTVFYLVEDWVLFSLSILLLIGILWTLRQALPRYWHQIQLFLNIGSVREGERVVFQGLPWNVQQINLFCTLVNPVANLKQRVPINDLVDMRSRPSEKSEPWFPCRQDDWVILNDGTRGKVTGISPEMVQLVQRGGAILTYQTSDFLANSPQNLSPSFRLKETLGISYALQKESTSTIPDILHQYILKRIEQEGYAEQLVNLRVEFALANSSSLDLVVMADFKGELGDLYNRLRRAIQRWCVDACSENGWEIPFPQMTLSGSLVKPG
jgi:hypothetical protein